MLKIFFQVCFAQLKEDYKKELVSKIEEIRDEGKKKKNRKLKTITIKEMGKYYADYPEILGYEF